MAQTEEKLQEKNGIYLRMDSHLSVDHDRISEQTNSLVLVHNNGAHFWNPHLQYSTEILKHGDGAEIEKKQEKDEQELKQKAFCANMQMICDIVDAFDDVEVELSVRDYATEVPASSWEQMVEFNPHLYVDNGFECGITDGYAEYLHNQDSPKDSLDYLIEDLMGSDPSTPSYSALSDSSLGSYDLLDDILMEPQAQEPDPHLSPVIISNVDLYNEFSTASVGVLATNDPIIVPQTDLTFTTGNPTGPAMPQGASSSGTTALTAQPSF
ncbi:MAG TPA: hypothetical protein PKI93_08285 [Alphaproteobacteria bacterium]|nr:hypothetical protein [Alphaproteobacteria bacterium]HNS45271.1 hypothetical protein [Alphaproteobacteria bacterium]